MSDLIGRSNPNYGEIAGKKYTRGTTSDTAGTIRNGFKKVVLESATGDISWRHQLSHLLKDANGDLIAGNSANLTDLNVPKEVELLMEEKAPSLNFAYGMEQPIEQTLNALLPKNSSVTKAVELLTVAVDLGSTFINGANKEENSVPTVFNPWTKSMPAWDQNLKNVKFSYTFNFRMGQYGLWNAKTEVFLPIINLIAPVLPRNISAFFSEGPIPGKTALLADSILGALKAGFDERGGKALAVNLIGAVKKFTYNISFGNTVKFENCLINGAKPSFSSDTDEKGYPVAGSVELAFTTIAPYGLVSAEDARAVRFGVNV